MTDQERNTFETKGWIGPYDLLTQVELGQLRDAHRSSAELFLRPEEMGKEDHPGRFARKSWFKSIHTKVTAFYDLATHPVIVNKVVSLLGPDVIAWGLTVKTLRPGTRHRWHVDIEHLEWPGISVFIALENVDRDTSLKVLDGSHTLHQIPQALSLNDDDGVWRKAEELGNRGIVAPVDMRDGQFFLFQGRIWHGSENSTDRTRLAAIVQYTRPTSRVRIPLSWDIPVQWDPTQPPCVLAAGVDSAGLNVLTVRSDCEQ